jgi:hypothetical protein
VLIARIKAELLDALRAHGFATIAEARGTAT